SETVVAVPKEAVALSVAVRGGRCPSRHTPALQNWEDGQFWSDSHCAPCKSGKHPTTRASGADNSSAARRRNGGRGRSIFSALRSVPARGSPEVQKETTTGAPPEGAAMARAEEGAPSTM